MLWIISGPSSVGKSTFLMGARCREITGSNPESSVFFAHDQPDSAASGSGDSFVHYNTLRPVDKFRRKWEAARQNKGRPSLPARLRQWVTSARDDDPTPEAWAKAAGNFQSDPAWAALCQREGPKKAIVLLADRERILARVRERRVGEQAQVKQNSKSYDPRNWLQLYEKLDLERLYRDWYAELDSCGIDYIVVDSNDEQFSPYPHP